MRVRYFLSSFHVHIAAVCIAAFTASSAEVFLSATLAEDDGVDGQMSLGESAVSKDFVDSDQDQLPDDWEILHGLNPNDPIDAALDSDCDGKSNLDEYFAGTDPQVFNDLQILSIESTAEGHCKLLVNGAAGHRYEVHSSTNLASWSAITGFWCGNSPERVDVVPEVDVNFFRLYTCTNPPRLDLRVFIEPPATNVIRFEVTAIPGHAYVLEGTATLGPTPLTWMEITNFYAMSCVTREGELNRASTLEFFRIRLK